MSQTKILNAIEAMNSEVKILQHEQSKINTLSNNDGIEFFSDKDFDEYIYLQSKIDGLKFISDELLSNMWFGDENKIIKEDYPYNYDIYMKGLTESIDIFISSFK